LRSRLRLGRIVGRRVCVVGARISGGFVFGLFLVVGIRVVARLFVRLVLCRLVVCLVSSVPLGA